MKGDQASYLQVVLIQLVGGCGLSRGENNLKSFKILQSTFYDNNNTAALLCLLLTGCSHWLMRLTTVAGMLYLYLHFVVASLRKYRRRVQVQ